MNIHTALGLLMIIPAIIALVQEGRDHTVKITCGILIGLAVFVCLDQYVGFIDDLLNGVWWQVVSIACAVLGTILVVRLNNHIIGTLIATGAGLLALIHLGVIN